MKIVDARAKTIHHDILVFIERAIREVEPRLMLGIRHIVLLDQDRYRKRSACARYVPVDGTNFHDIELYFEHYAEAPAEVAGNPVFVGAMTLRALFHEIYHHKLAFHHHDRHPEFAAEQAEATRWAEDQLGKILAKVFAGEEYEQQREELYRMAKSNKALEQTDHACISALGGQRPRRVGTCQSGPASAPAARCHVRDKRRGAEAMQARAPLMIEHRLIERMIHVVHHALELAEKTRSVDPAFVDLAVDFIRTYADRTHHGKEEDILFRRLDTRSLSEVDRRVMNELIEEHKFGRMTTKALSEANLQYRNGNDSALAEITAQFRTLAQFYPKHIQKEDRVFFPACRAYLSEEEDQAMLAEFMEFDRKMIHEKYTAIVSTLEHG